MKVLRCRAFLRLLCGVCLFIMGTMLLRQESIRIVITECMGRFWVPMFQPMDPVGNGTMYVPGSGKAFVTLNVSFCSEKITHYLLMSISILLY